MMAKNKRVVKRACRVTIDLKHVEGAELSLIGDGGRGTYLRVEIPTSSGNTRSVCAWCYGRSMRAFVAEIARRLGLAAEARAKKGRAT